MARTTFELPSADGATTIVGDLWTPEGSTEDARGIVQLIHGMSEHIGRYDHFAQYLNARGYMVVGHDHLGHGRSVDTTEAWGVLEPYQGAGHLIEDVHAVRAYVHGRYPGLPHLMFGHSMGSFVLRNYLALHGEGLAGAVVCATGWQSPVALAFGSALTSAIGHVRGWSYRSPLVNALADGAYGRAFPEAEGGTWGWLSRDAAQREAYKNDPACGFKFSVAAYHELFSLVAGAQKRRRISGMQAEVPVMLISGSKDPVGSNGKAAPKVAALMTSCGVRSVEVSIYGGARHELLNEINRDEVYANVLSWFDACVGVNSKD